MENEWIKVEDKPKKAGIYLVYQQNKMHEDYQLMVLAFHLDSGVFVDIKDKDKKRARAYYPYVTHWAEIKPPKQ